MSELAKKVSEHLETIAKLMDVDGDNPYKVRAYLYASSQTIGRTEQELASPMNITGVGPSISTVIKEFTMRGTSTKFENLCAKWPLGVLSLMRVQGIGSRRAVTLYEQGIRSFEELVEHARDGKLNDKLTQNVLNASAVVRRIPIEEIIPIAEQIKSRITPLVDRAEICGSIRRHVAACKDIDIVVQAADPVAAKRAFESIGKVLWSGPMRSAIYIGHPALVQCDMWIVESWQWGAALGYATGSKNHNTRLRGMLKARGLRMNEYGIYAPIDGSDLDGKKVVYTADGAYINGEKVAERKGGTDEKDAYDILGIPYVQPSQRSE